MYNNIYKPSRKLFPSTEHHVSRQRLGASGGQALGLLGVAVGHGGASHLARVDGIGAVVVLDGAGTLDGGGLVHKGIAVDLKGAAGVARVLDQGSGDATDGAAGSLGTSVVTGGSSLGGSGGRAGYRGGVDVARSSGVVGVAAVAALVAAPVAALALALAGGGRAAGAGAGGAGAGRVTAVVIIASAGVVGAAGIVAAVTTIVTVVTVVATVVAVASSDGEVLAVVLGSTLGNGHQDRLMVGGGRHGAHAVVASGQPAGDGGRDETLAVSGVVDTLEESELGRIQRCGRAQRVSEVLDGDVGVTDNLAILEILRSRVVGARGVGEVAQDHVGHVHGDVERGGRVQVLVVGGADDHSRDHGRLRRDLTHDCDG